MHLRVASVVGILACAGACGDDALAPDAYDGPCWPLPSTPGGEVTIGTGDTIYEPMPDMVTIVANASQSDPFVQIHSRIRGMPPGNFDDLFDPENPKTKVSAMITGVGLLTSTCPASIGYIPAPEDGAFDILHSLRVGIGMIPLSEVVGKQAVLTVEVVGSNGLYAKDEKTVTLVAPPADPTAH